MVLAHLGKKWSHLGPQPGVQIKVGLHERYKIYYFSYVHGWHTPEAGKEMKIYVASSWRNDLQPGIVELLRSQGHEVYDFKKPDDNGDSGFHWSDIDPAWETWSPEQFIRALDHPLAVAGFKRDFDAMHWADAFVLVMPCGRSAHKEAGWAVGAKKPLAVLLSDGEPELMYNMATELVTNALDLIRWADRTNVELKTSTESEI